MIYLILQLFNIAFWAALLLAVAWKDLSDRRYSIWWGLIFFVCGDKKPLMKTIHNKQYMGSCILVAGILFITYGLIGEIYAEKLADKTWVWYAAYAMIPLGLLLRLPRSYFIKRR